MTGSSERALISTTCSQLAASPALGASDAKVKKAIKNLSLQPKARKDVRREISEGNSKIRRERREAAREIYNADSPWEARQEIREAQREISRKSREQRRGVRREVKQTYWDW